VPDVKIKELLKKLLIYLSSAGGLCQKWK